jgi:hypothetical protein
LNDMRITALFFATLTVMQLFGQNNIKGALKLWEAGDFSRAYSMTQNILQKDPDNNEANYLQMKILFVQGQYKKALDIFSSLHTTFNEYSEAADLATEAYLHLHDYENAWEVADKNNISRSLYKELKDRPFSVIADRTLIISFLNDPQIPSIYWPGINGTLNGKKVSIRFDTGADFLVIGKSVAEKYGLQLKYEDQGMHGSSQVKMWHAIADRVTFGNELIFLNIPVTIMETLGEYVIFGTNMLEPFLTTVDYPNDRFIFTPRNRPELFVGHYKMLYPNQKTISFYLWQDHYMIAKGKFAGRDNLNLFFDSGLIALTEIDGKKAQASFNASRESLLKWRFDKSKMKQTTFFPTEYSLEVSGLNQPNTLVYYDNNLHRDRIFGGIRIDGLISHGWLKNYSWTIDFDKMEYSFGVKPE